MFFNGSLITFRIQIMILKVMFRKDRTGYFTTDHLPNSKEKALAYKGPWIWEYHWALAVSYIHSFIEDVIKKGLSVSVVD